MIPTRFVKEEILRCMDDPKEFIKYITDHPQSVEHIQDTIYDRSCKIYIDDDYVNVFVAVLAIWRAMSKENQSVMVFSKHNRLVMDAVRYIISNGPSFILPPAIETSQNRVRFSNGSLITWTDKVCGARGMTVNSLLIVDPKSFGIDAIKEFEECVIPVMSCMKDSNICTVEPR